MAERTIHVVVLQTGAVECVFTGDWITKREFERVLKTINLEYKNRIRLYRQSRKVEQNGKCK